MKAVFLKRKEANMYEYAVKKVVYVVDGDTVDIEILDLGLDVPAFLRAFMLAYSPFFLWHITSYLYCISNYAIICVSAPYCNKYKATLLSLIIPSGMCH